MVLRLVNVNQGGKGIEVGFLPDVHFSGEQVVHGSQRVGPFAIG